MFSGTNDICWLAFVTLLLYYMRAVHAQESHGHGGSTKCYDNFNRPQRCIPEFENAAYGVLMEATETCGDEGTIEFCVQTGSSAKKSCDVCRTGDHGPRYLTDLHDQDNQTWWQSPTMYEGVQYPSQVNLTLNLRKAFDITYVRLWFYSPRPESFAIYKRTKANGPWEPYQFYSATCRDMYGLPDNNHASRGEAETRALCTSEYSDISPLRGGNVAFSTLEGRPSAYQFDSSADLQEWVTATELRITLDRLNTFGDEVFGDAQVMRSYFYAIADVAVGARCKCNGHASECVSSSGADGTRRRVCRCEHNTAGPDCGECLPFYNDAPWGRASSTNVHECKACNCNGFSDRCVFDRTLYEQTGHGGHCLDCRANRDGPNCERCRENYHQYEDSYCIPCDCDPTGSRSLQCDASGRCQCKPGVTGDKCDRCDADHYDFGPRGCRPCECSVAGSLNNKPSCDPHTGVCACKEHVEGQKCRECKPGFFSLDVDNKFGCTPCFCYYHSSECTSAMGYSKVTTESMFARGSERWSARDDRGLVIPVQYKALEQNIGVSSVGGETLYFTAPDRFLGDQRASYNHYLSFTLRIGESGPSPSATDVILEGSGGQISLPIFAQGHSVPSVRPQRYSFLLHEHPDYGWQPRLGQRNFLALLSNLTAIKVRGTYSGRAVGFLDDVKLETVHRGSAGQPATWIETCTCPAGYIGQYCESCAPGFRHTPANGGPFASCVPCECNGHTDICDSDTGRCICDHNTAGDNCELCARGYYGSALGGTPYDCKVCPCPERGACLQLPDETVVCLECPAGYAGPRCDLCSDGFYGDPTGRQTGYAEPCKPCDCNNNVDVNAVGNCNRTTGACLKCIHHTAGERCDQCLPGYYGDALALPQGDCRRCACNPYGTEYTTEAGPPKCDQISGYCSCKPHVTGKNCDVCELGFYDLTSGTGCQDCKCDPVGSLGPGCDVNTGQCQCRPGVTGKRCDSCSPLHYGFSATGCAPCDCDETGSQSLQCDMNGQCPCNENVEGRRCDRCKENTHDRKRGCIDCPHCYNLVRDAAQRHRDRLQEMQKVLSDIKSNPTVVDNTEFDEKLSQIQKQVDKLAEDAKLATGSGDKSLLDHVSELQVRLSKCEELVDQVNVLAEEGRVTAALGKEDLEAAQIVIEAATKELNDALDFLGDEGVKALERATNRSQQLGHQSDAMSQIVKEAQHLAQQLEEDDLELRETAQRALNVSSEAYDVAKGALDTQDNVTYSIRELTNALENSKTRLEITLAHAKDTLDRAAKAQADALLVYTEVDNAAVPDIDVGKLRDDAKYVVQESESVKAAAEELFVGPRGDKMNEVEDQIDYASELVNRVIEQQNDIDSLLAEADSAKNTAKEAVELGDKTLAEAQKTLQTLLGFHEEVESSRNAAYEALTKDKVVIEKDIMDAMDQILEAEISLSGAVSNAENAKATALEAQSQAQHANKVAHEILEQANSTKAEAYRYKIETDDLSKRINDTALRIDLLEGQAKDEEELTGSAKTLVGQAKSDAEEAAKQVEKALKDVESIMKELQKLPDIDKEDLLNLERKLVEAENVIEKANLDVRIEQLRASQKKQQSWIRDHSDEFQRLQSEVESVQAIADALPVGCFKRPRLEPY